MQVGGGGAFTVRLGRARFVPTVLQGVALLPVDGQAEVSHMSWGLIRLPGWPSLP